MNAKLSSQEQTDLSVIGKIVVVVPQFSQWTGTRAMREGDYHIGTNGKLPPKEVTKSLGLKAIIDTVHLRVFDRLKHRAETILESCGVRFLSGWAIPADKSATVFQQLDEVVAKYDAAKIDFLNRYDTLVDEWASKNPEFSKEILDAKLDRQSVAQRISAQYEPFKLQPVSDEKTEALAKSVGGLADELINSVAQLARTFFKESFLGKDRANRKTVNAVIRIRERLCGLSFLSGRINPLLTMIDNVLSGMPSEGYFGGEAFWKLATLVKTLGDPDLLEEIIRGQMSVDGLLHEEENQAAADSQKSMQETDTSDAEAPPLPLSEVECNKDVVPAELTQQGTDLFSNIDAFFDRDEPTEEQASQAVTESTSIPSPSSHQEQSSDFPVLPDVEEDEGFYF